MVQLSSSSNPPEAHVAKHLLTGGLTPEDVASDDLPEPDGLIEWMPPLPEPPPDPLACAQAVAERDLLKQRVAELEAAVTTLEDRCDEYAAALNDRAELCDRLRAYYRRERRAVEMLGRELETRSGICACDVQDGWEQHRGGSVVGACWAEWAQQQARARAREEAAKTGTTQKGNG